MVKKPKRTSKMLALLMAVVMTVGSVPTTAFAANSSSIGASSSSSTIIDDPLSGTTGSGWDNIDSGTGTPVTPCNPLWEILRLSLPRSPKIPLPGGFCRVEPGFFH